MVVESPSQRVPHTNTSNPCNNDRHIMEQRQLEGNNEFSPVMDLRNVLSPFPRKFEKDDQRKANQSFKSSRRASSVAFQRKLSSIIPKKSNHLILKDIGTELLMAHKSFLQDMITVLDVEQKMIIEFHHRLNDLQDEGHLLSYFETIQTQNELREEIAQNLISRLLEISYDSENKV